MANINANITNLQVGDLSRYQPEEQEEIQRQAVVASVLGPSLGPSKWQLEPTLPTAQKLKLAYEQIDALNLDEPVLDIIKKEVTTKLVREHATTVHNEFEGNRWVPKVLKKQVEDYRLNVKFENHTSPAISRFKDSKELSHDAIKPTDSHKEVIRKVLLDFEEQLNPNEPLFATNQLRRELLKKAALLVRAEQTRLSESLEQYNFLVSKSKDGENYIESAADKLHNEAKRNHAWLLERIETEQFSYNTLERHLEENDDKRSRESRKSLVTRDIIDEAAKKVQTPVPILGKGDTLDGECNKQMAIRLKLLAQSGQQFRGKRNEDPSVVERFLTDVIICMDNKKNARVGLEIMHQLVAKNSFAWDVINAYRKQVRKAPNRQAQLFQELWIELQTFNYGKESVKKLIEQMNELQLWKPPERLNYIGMWVSEMFDLVDRYYDAEEHEERDHQAFLELKSRIKEIRAEFFYMVDSQITQKIDTLQGADGEPTNAWGLRELWNRFSKFWVDTTFPSKRPLLSEPGRYTRLALNSKNVSRAIESSRNPRTPTRNNRARSQTRSGSRSRDRNSGKINTFGGARDERRKPRSKKKRNYKPQEDRRASNTQQRQQQKPRNRSASNPPQCEICRKYHHGKCSHYPHQEWEKDVPNCMNCGGKHEGKCRDDYRINEIRSSSTSSSLNTEPATPALGAVPADKDVGAAAEFSDDEQ